MIRVTIEVIPFGDKTRARDVGVIDIVNNGTGDSKSGNYDIMLIDKSEDAVTSKHSKVLNFDRASKDPFMLLSLALNSIKSKA